jgi:hypothetical protein
MKQLSEADNNNTTSPPPPAWLQREMQLATACGRTAQQEGTAGDAVKADGSLVCQTSLV